MISRFVDRIRVTLEVFIAHQGITDHVAQQRTGGNGKNSTGESHARCSGGLLVELGLTVLHFLILLRSKSTHLIFIHKTFRHSTVFVAFTDDRAGRAFSRHLFDDNVFSVRLLFDDQETVLWLLLFLLLGTAGNCTGDDNAHTAEQRS